MGGYRIYRSYNPQAEFSEVTQTTFKQENYTDTVAITNLNRKIYYKILAEDQRFNRSKFTEIFVLDKPDIIPPSSPILNNYEVTTDGIRVYWIPSGSPDVSSHVVYRKTGDEQEVQWEKLFESKSLQDFTFHDSTLQDQNVFSYTVVARDSVGLESIPAKPVSVIWTGKAVKDEDIKFFGTVNRELRFINLTWKVKDFHVLEYRLYRSTDNHPLKLYKTMEGTSKGFNDVDLEVNTNYTYGLQWLSRF